MSDEKGDKVRPDTMAQIKTEFDKFAAGFLGGVARIVEQADRARVEEVRASIQAVLMQALSVGDGRPAAPPLPVQGPSTVDHRMRTRPVQDIITERLAQSAGPTHRSDVQAAVVAEGYTTSAFKKRVKILQDLGIVERSGSTFALKPSGQATSDVDGDEREEDAS